MSNNGEPVGDFQKSDRHAGAQRQRADKEKQQLCQHGEQDEIAAELQDIFQAVHDTGIHDFEADFNTRS